MSRCGSTTSAAPLRGDIGIDDVLDMAAAIGWMGEQPQRGAAQRELLLVVIDGLRPRPDWSSVLPSDKSLD